MGSRKPDRLFLAGAIALTTVAAATAGDLNPPAGPVTPTMLTLDQVEARTPISSVAGDGSFVHVIDSPGNYFLDQDVVAPFGVNGIQIDASNVTIDLNGFTLSGSASSTNQDGIVVTDSVNLVNIHIRNGSILAFGRDAVRMMSVNSATITGLYISENGNAQKVGGAGIYIGDNPGAETVVISDCVFVSQLPSIVTEQETIVRDCVIDLGSVILGDNCVVERCTTRLGFVTINGDRNVVQNCNIIGSPSVTILGERNLVIQNVMHPAPNDASGGSTNIVGPVVTIADFSMATNPFANIVAPH